MLVQCCRVVCNAGPTMNPVYILLCFPSQTTPQFRDGNGLFSQLVDLQAKSEGNEDLQFSDGDMRVVISNLLLAGKYFIFNPVFVAHTFPKKYQVHVCM